MRILCFHYANERQTVSINSFLLCMARLMKLFSKFITIFKMAAEDVTRLVCMLSQICNEM